MSADRIVAVVGLSMALILVGSGLRRRGFAADRRWLGMALLWAGIITLVWIAVLLGQHLKP